MKENEAGIDSLDKQILQQMSRGVNSYEDLSHKLNVTRSTIYRRVDSLEKRGLIHRITRSEVDYEKLEVVAVCFAFKISLTNQKRIFSALKAHKRVKLLWRAFGDHNAVFLAFCSRGEEGEVISELKGILEKYAATEITVSVGFGWEKTDFSPFSDEEEKGKQLKFYYSDEGHVANRHIDLKLVSALEE